MGHRSPTARSASSTASAIYAREHSPRRREEGKRGRAVAVTTRQVHLHVIAPIGGRCRLSVGEHKSLGARRAPLYGCRLGRACVVLVVHVDNFPEKLWNLRQRRSKTRYQSTATTMSHRGRIIIVAVCIIITIVIISAAAARRRRHDKFFLVNHLLRQLAASVMTEGAAQRRMPHTGVSRRR